MISDGGCCMLHAGSGGKAGSLRVLTPIANPAAAVEIEEVG